MRRLLSIPFTVFLAAITDCGCTPVQPLLVPAPVADAGVMADIATPPDAAHGGDAVLAADTARAPNDSAGVDFTGSYTGAITNRENDCNIGGNWMVGMSSPGTTLMITQADAAIEVDVQGFAGFALALFTGSGGPLRGTAVGNTFTVSRSASRPTNVGPCAFTPRIEARATLTGNALDGVVTYRYETNGHPSCAFRATCTSSQAFAFVRPPR